MKNFFSLLRRFFSGYLTTIASITSLIGFILLAFAERIYALIALIAIIGFLTVILIRIFFLVRSFLLQKTKDGYHKFATYVRYTTLDGSHIRYEIQKYIQCKNFVMDEHIHEYNWTGKYDPKISSRFQEFIHLTKTPPGIFDQAVFKFKPPLIYNEFCVVDICMDLDDSDNISEHLISQRVSEKVQLITFRVELLHFEEHKEAKIMRRMRKKDFIGQYVFIDWVKFDVMTRSYEYVLFNPEVGYDYKIDWS